MLGAKHRALNDTRIQRSKKVLLYGLPLMTPGRNRPSLGAADQDPRTNRIETEAFRAVPPLRSELLCSAVSRMLRLMPRSQSGKPGASNVYWAARTGLMELGAPINDAAKATPTPQAKAASATNFLPAGSPTWWGNGLLGAAVGLASCAVSFCGRSVSRKLQRDERFGPTISMRVTPFPAFRSPYCERHARAPVLFGSGLPLLALYSLWNGSSVQTLSGLLKSRRILCR